jgi:hypothetical protein
MEWLQCQVEADANGNMFSELSRYWIGEVFAMYHCINQIQLYCPWAVNFKKQWFESKFSDALAPDFAAHNKVRVLTTTSNPPIQTHPTRALKAGDITIQLVRDEVKRSSRTCAEQKGT